MNEIFVTNKNSFHHTDFFNGQRYDFAPGERTLVSVDAARHMLGFGRSDKTENLVRLGWANLGDDEGVKRLAKFVFTQPRIVEEPIEDAPAVPEGGGAASAEAAA